MTKQQLNIILKKIFFLQNLIVEQIKKTGFEKETFEEKKIKQTEKVFLKCKRFLIMKAPAVILLCGLFAI